jgi:hypothetical protein
MGRRADCQSVQIANLSRAEKNFNKRIALETAGRTDLIYWF